VADVAGPAVLDRVVDPLLPEPLAEPVAIAHDRLVDLLASEPPPVPPPEAALLRRPPAGPPAAPAGSSGTGSARS